MILSPGSSILLRFVYLCKNFFFCFVHLNKIIWWLWIHKNFRFIKNFLHYVCLLLSVLNIIWRVVFDTFGPLQLNCKNFIMNFFNWELVINLWDIFIKIFRKNVCALLSYVLVFCMLYSLLSTSWSWSSYSIVCLYN